MHIKRNNKAVEIKKILVIFWKESLVLFSWNCGHAASGLCLVGS